VIDDVCRLVELHLRFHGYGSGEWTDSAVRRFVRDAGPLLGRLLKLPDLPFIPVLQGYACQEYQRCADLYAAAGIELMLAPARALDLTLDKLALARCCAGHVRVPRTECFDDALDPASWDYPVVLKPRTGSGSRDISVVASAQDLAGLERSAEFIVQEYLPGEEYSIDVLADTGSHVIAAVPRVRSRVDSGVSVAGRTVHDAELEHLGATVASVTGLTYIANVQARRDVDGRPALLEVNPRAPGALPLTMASGVDMPRLAMDALRGLPVPGHVDFHEVAMVRFLEERFMDLSEVQKVAA